MKAEKLWLEEEEKVASLSFEVTDKHKQLDKIHSNKLVYIENIRS